MLSGFSISSSECLRRRAEENITLMCLRILQKLIKPPAPTSKKNKDTPVDSLTTVKPYSNEIHAQAQLWLKRDPKASYEVWKKCLPARGLEANGKSPGRTELRHLYLTEKYAWKWKQFMSKRGKRTCPLDLKLGHNNWLRQVLFTPATQAARQAACTIVEALATIPSRKQQVLDLLTSYLDELSVAGECAAEYLALYQKLIKPARWKVYLAARGVLPYVGNLITKEIARLLALEEATLSTDLQQGYALKSITGLLSSFVEVESIKRHFKSRLVGTVLNGYLCLRKLVVQRTKLIDETQDMLLEMLEDMTTGTESETKAFMAVCIETAKRYSLDDYRTPVFIFERLCSIIYPEENEVTEFFVTLEKDPQQEDFLQGRMPGNPYSSNEPGIGPLMRDIKNKICQDCDLVALLEDDSGMELLVNNKIISLDLPVAEVYKKVWCPTNEGEPMRIIYRMRGLLGDATEEFIESLDSTTDEEEDEEEVYKMAGVMAQCGGLGCMLNRLTGIKDFKQGRHLLTVLLKLFSYCVKVKVNRQQLVKMEMNTLNVMLGTLNLALVAEQESKDSGGAAVAEQVLSIMEIILDESNAEPLSEDKGNLILTLATAASTELESLEQQLEDSQVEKFNIKQMKDLFEQKAAQLATEIVELKAKYDEEMSLRELAEQKVTNLTQELQKQKGVCEDLNTELLQRPGVEDVAVLKRELVQVQTLMDKMTLECEKESEKLKDECNHLRAEYTNAEATINKLNAELAKGPQEVATYVQEIQKLQTSVNEFAQKNENLMEKIKKKELEYAQLEERQNEESVDKRNLQGILNQKELDCQQLQARLSASEDSLQRLQKELCEKGEASQKLKEELSEVEAKNQHLKVEYKQLQQQREEKEQRNLLLQNELNQLHNKLLKTEHQLGEAQGRLKEQRQLSSEKLMEKEQQVADIQLKLSRAEEELKEKAANATELQHQLDKTKQQHQEQQNLQQSTTAKLREAQNDLEQVLRQIGDKDQKIQNLEALLQKSKENISLLEKEREDLYAKIQAGEGETAVLNQLQEKNHALQEQVTQLAEKLKNQSESHKQALENLHEQVQEQKSHLRASQDHVLSLETTISELRNQLSESKEKVMQLDLQVKAKTELLLSAEAAKAAQRADLQNHLDTAQNALQDKQQELTKVSTQLDQVASKLHDKEEYCIQLESSLKEYKEKHLNLEQKTEELEGQHKKFETDLFEVLGQKEKALQELEQERKQCTELNLRAAELSKQLEEEREMLSRAKLDLQKKNDTLEELSQQKLKQEEENEKLKLEIEKLIQDKLKYHRELDGKLQTLTDDLKKMKLEKDTLLKELEILKGKLSNSNESLEEAKDALEKEKQRGKTAVAEIEKSCQEARHQLQLQSESIAKEQNELKNLLEKQDGISKQLAAELDSARVQVLQLQGILKDKENNEQQLQLKVKELKESFDQKKKQNEIQQAELKTALLEKAELENKLQQQITLSEQVLATQKEKITELQKFHKKAQENMEKLQLDIYGKESEILAIRQDLKVTEEKLALAQEELISNRNQISNHNQLIKELKSIRSTLEQDILKKEQQLKEQEKLLQEIQKDKDLKEKDLFNEKSKTSELYSINCKQEEENVKLRDEIRFCKQEFEKEISNQKDAKQLLIKQKLELQEKVDNFSTAMEQEKKNQEVMKDQWKKKEGELKKKCAEIEAKLQALIKKKDEQCKSHEEAECKLNMQITALNENLGTVKKEWQSSQRRASELEKQIDDLRGEIAVLEATVQNNQDERRVLLERCLKSEGEIEKLQSKVMDARRKLDDTTAAMQELGRENQSLQIKHTQALNRKWAEDNEVQNCMACGKGFSVTIRRHHCRQCGNIFCAECSSKNALTPSSKKPVRVCDTCFNDLQG